MSNFILVRDCDNYKEIKYVNLDNVDMIIPEVENGKDMDYEVTIYFNGTQNPIHGYISYETAEQIFENFQFEGEVIDDE